MTQCARVLAALRSRGANGITRVDFMPPNVIDGGKPILNIPGRIYDLKADGHTIVDEGERDACTVYRLLRDAQDAPAPTPVPEYVDRDLSLWGDSDVVSAPASAILGDDWDEAA